MNADLVTIIIVNYNELKATMDLLNSLTNSTQEYEIFVIDNASIINPKPSIRQAFPAVKVIVNPQNLGYGAAVNIGLQLGRGQFYLILNNDLVLDDKDIHILRNQLSSSTTLGAVSPVLLNVDKDRHGSNKSIQYAGMTRMHPVLGRNRMLKIPIRSQRDPNIGKTSSLHGACMMVKKEVVEKTGNMNEDYFLYYEELDWSQRIIAGEFEIGVVLNTQVLHNTSLSIDKIGGKKFYYLYLNRYRYMYNFSKSFDFLLFKWYFKWIALPRALCKMTINGNAEGVKAIRKVYRDLKTISRG